MGLGAAAELSRIKSAAVAVLGCGIWMRASPPLGILAGAAIAVASKETERGPSVWW
jgi:hypothetical protein